MLEKKRWRILIASVIVNFCIGSAYAWSVFQKPLTDMFGWSTAQASLAFTLSLSLSPFSMILGGKIQEKTGPRPVIALGGIIFGLGIFLGGYTSSLAMIYLTYGLMGGVGLGFIYGCTIPNTVKWFPDKRGTSGGLITGGFGMGSVVLAPIAVQLISKLGVLTTFKILGAFFTVFVCLMSLLISAPEPGYVPAGWTPPAPAAGAPTAANLSASQMVRTGRFWVLWIMYIIACIAGLMIIGHASPIGQEQIGLSPAVAAGAVSFLGLANTLGRMMWGTFSDKIGRYNTLIVLYGISAGMLVLLNMADSFLLFVVAIMGIANSFGGFLGIFPSITADNFGSKHLSTNYGFMFVAYGIAAFVGPRLAAVVKQSGGGGYALAFLTASVMSAAGIAMTLLFKARMKQWTAASDQQVS